MDTLWTPWRISIVELIEIFKNTEELEAPPGFEPGMEVLQFHPRSLSQSTILTNYRGNSGVLAGSVRSSFKAMVCPVGWNWVF
jgi:hypothetical protein